MGASGGRRPTNQKTPIPTAQSAAAIKKDLLSFPATLDPTGQRLGRP
jgi:hypothetical protein